MSDLYHDSRMKVYPASGQFEIMRANRQIFREAVSDSSGTPSFPPPAPASVADACRASVQARACTDAEENKSDLSDSKPDNSAENLDRSKRRARSRVRDLALSNTFEYFVTLTIAPGQIDRYDIREIMKRVNRWLDNHVRRSGLRYVLVPEYHKDGAIHFHGFFSGLPVADSGHVDRGGHKVYNITDWTFGFSTAIGLYGDYASAVGYVCKYISKAQAKIGGRWYYSGGALAEPVLIFDHIPEATKENFTFRVAEVGLEISIERGKL